MLYALRRLLEMEAPDWLHGNWTRTLYWLLWLALAGLAGALLLAALNGR